MDDEACSSTLALSVLESFDDDAFGLNDEAYSSTLSLSLFESFDDDAFILYDEAWPSTIALSVFKVLEVPPLQPAVTAAPPRGNSGSQPCKSSHLP